MQLSGEGAPPYKLTPYKAQPFPDSIKENEVKKKQYSILVVTEWEKQTSFSSKSEVIA